MRCVIVSGGTAPGQKLFEDSLKGAELVVGVDGAAEIFNTYGIVPDVLIGDFDTADPECVKMFARKGVIVCPLNEEKNETDTEAAIDFAISQGADDITILGALGGRVDHLLSNVMMLVRADKAGVKCNIKDEQCELFVSDKRFSLSGEKGQTISILPLTGEVCVSADGLKYPLNELLLKWGSSRGISNIMQGSSAELFITGGYALIVKNIIVA